MDKKIISILTATRAEYGLLKPVISKLIQSGEYDVRLVASGMHLSPDFGFTYREIEQDGFSIDRKIEILSTSDEPAAISCAMGQAMILFGKYFEELKPDLLLVLGDRYETLAVCIAAMNAGVPIAHLYGGETTQGALDENIRHAITKLSWLHFTSTEEYRKRVIQLGEAPDRTFTVGALGIENIKNTVLLSRKELSDKIGIKPDLPYAVVTFHPVTLESDAGGQLLELLHACEEMGSLHYIFTKANADTGGRVINDMLDTYAKSHRNISVHTSLGSLGYLSALKYAELVIGNSSSGLIEAPSFKIPTVNIGDRQKGRLQSTSVINCLPKKASIVSAIRKALSREFKSIAGTTVNPYGDGCSSDHIIRVIKSFLSEDRQDLKKVFYDMKFEVQP